MKTNVIKTDKVFWAGALLTLPAVYFIFISILKYGLGIPGLFDSSQPVLENLGIKESFGFNINLFILMGPFIALLLNLFAVLKIEGCNENEMLSIKLSIKKHWWNIAVIILSGILLATLIIYSVGENCTC